MRVDIKKVLFVGSNHSLDLFFERAQEIGWFQFVSVTKTKAHIFPKPIEDLKLAIKELRKLLVSHKQAAINFSEVPSLVERVLILKREIENLHEEIRYIKAEITKMHPLGYFDVQELMHLEAETKKRFRFFFVRHDKYLKNQVPPELIYLNREFDFDYYMLISANDFQVSGFVEIPIERSLSELEKELRRLQKVSHESETELKSMADYYESFEDFFVHEMNKINLSFSKQDAEFCLEEHLFSIDAWIPINHLDQLRRLTHDLPIHYEEVIVEKEDAVPTYLENKGLGQVGQDLVEIYDTPYHFEKDPSTWVVWSFAIFFGMIVSDACYGILFLLLSLFLWAKYPKMKKPIGKRMVKLITLLSCTSIIWGVMIASYFGIKLQPDGPLNRISLLHYLGVHKVDFYKHQDGKIFHGWVHEFPEIVNTLPSKAIFGVKKIAPGGSIEYPIMDEMYNSLLMELSIIAGVIHLSLSFLRNLKQSWSGIGWIATIWGGYLFFPSFIDATSLFTYMNWLTPEACKIVGEQLLYGGLVVAVVLAIIQEKLAGVSAIFKAIEVFADTLSYLRLYALGLASMALAVTFNEMGQGAGYILGGLIILGGHTINIGLGAAAGLIHGLRLNFLEWYHHCYTGGGKKFNPLRLITRE